MEGLQIDLPYLGADDVIEEVVVILAKLEKDRMETRSSLQKERDRGKKLRSKIDTLAQDRLINLPKAVQKGECLLHAHFSIKLINYSVIYFRHTQMHAVIHILVHNSLLW